MRDMTTRPNIQYSVVKYKREEEDQIVREVVQRKKRENLLLEQVIVYARSVKQTKRLA